MLEVRGIETYYGNIPALRGISIDVPEGGVVAIIGANGAGKTTLMKTIAGVLRRRSGTVSFLGEEITGLPSHKIVRRGVALVPEGRAILSRMTVRENLDIQRRLRLMAQSITASRHHPGHDVDDHAEAFETMAKTIAQHSESPLTVREVTAAAGLSPGYGMRLFKRTSGMSIIDYLTRIRVSSAQRLLVTSDLKISEIARQSGFHTVCRLYIAFQRFCNQTPRRYRLAMRRTLA